MGRIFKDKVGKNYSNATFNSHSRLPKLENFFWFLSHKSNIQFCWNRMTMSCQKCNLMVFISQHARTAQWQLVHFRFPLGFCHPPHVTCNGRMAESLWKTHFSAALNLFFPFDNILSISKDVNAFKDENNCYHLRSQKFPFSKDIKHLLILW